ncbi:MAG: Eco57I restriction-modification methylase domain-containing protein, partial [Anaerolineae bacterium]
DLVTSGGFDWRSGTVLDPASGGGAFLAPVARRIAAALLAQGHRCDHALAEIAQRVRGIEVDPFLAWLAQVSLELQVAHLCGADTGPVPDLVVTHDALDMPDSWPERRYDLVIGNPPYGRVTLPDCLRRRYQDSLYGHANLYGLFTHAAVRVVRQGGLVAFVTPSSILGGQYFKNLRQLLLEVAPPIAIDFVADRSGVFDGVLQETILVLFRVGETRRNVTLHSIRPFSLADPCEVVAAGRAVLPPAGADPWLLPRDASNRGLIEAADRMPYRLSDYGYEVSTGPLVWNRHKEQLRSEPGHGSYPLIWAEAVLPDGSFRFKADRANHRPYFAVRPGQEHLVTREACLLVQRTTAKEQRRRLVAARLPKSFVEQHGGVVVENHVNVIRATNGSPRVSLAAVEHLLNSGAADALFRCISGSVAVSAYELERLPLPAPEDATYLDAALDRGAPPADIEATIRRIYGVSQ